MFPSVVELGYVQAVVQVSPCNQSSRYCTLIEVAFSIRTLASVILVTLVVLPINGVIFIGNKR